MQGELATCCWFATFQTNESRSYLDLAAEAGMTQSSVARRGRAIPPSLRPGSESAKLLGRGEVEADQTRPDRPTDRQTDTHLWICVLT